MNLFFQDVDAYPLHFYMHLVHAAEVIGYKYPETLVAQCWTGFYYKACENFHMNPETMAQMDSRLKY